MANLILKQGAKGKPVQELQKFLNLKGKLAKPIAESGEFDAETKEAVKAFQKKNGLTPDGAVGSGTAAALAKLVGSSAGGWARPFGAPVEEEKQEPKEELVSLTIGGKKGTMTKAEFAEFQKKAKDAIRGTLRAAQQQSVKARALWDHFYELNTAGGVDGVIAWAVSLTGPKLPDVGLICDAEAAVKRLESALNGTDFDKIASAVQGVSDPVNKAAKTMWTYQKEVIGSAENWVTGLEVTRDLSFEVAKAIAKYELGGNAAAVKFVDAGAEFIKSAATEAGKAMASTSGGVGDAALNIVRDAGIAAVMSLLMGEGSKGKQFFESLEKTLLSQLKDRVKWLAGRPALAKFISGWITKYLSSNASTIAKESMSFLSSKTTFDQLKDNVAKSLVSSFPLAGLDVWVDGKMASSTMERMKKFPAFMAELKAQKITAVQEKIAFDILKKELLNGSASKLVEKGLDAALEKNPGGGSEQIGKAAIEEMAKMSEFKALCQKVAKGIK